MGAFVGAVLALSDPENGPEIALELASDEDRIAYWAGFILNQPDGEACVETWRELGHAVAKTNSDALERWLEWSRESAERVGLFAAGDLAAAIKCLKSGSEVGRGMTVSTPSEFRQLLVEMPTAARLHDFAFSSEFLGRRWSITEWD